MNTEDLPSSQATNEDPTLTGAEAGEATLILTPDNAEARLAFFEVVEWLHEQSDSLETLQAQDHARKYMWVSQNQTRDAEATRLLRPLAAGDLSSSPMSSPQNKSSSRPVDVPPEPSLEIWTVTFGNLRYRIEYARFSQTKVYKTRLKQYLQDIMGAQVSQSMLALTPTPSETGSITVGQWTLTAILGTGG